MTWSFWVAIVVVIATVYALIKRYETRLVLLTSGFVMAFISLQPMIAFKQFDKSMTNGSRHLLGARFCCSYLSDQMRRSSG